MLKFYNREKEIALLREIEERSRTYSQMTMLVGRRRVGKTTLLRNAFADDNTLYFFITKKTEPLLCEEFAREANEKLSLALGSYTSFAKLFKALMIEAQKRHFTLIVDEFQDFAKINPAVFSEIQNIWDSNKDKAKINVIFCGSIYSIMKKIFEHSKEPLFGRITARLVLKPFELNVIRQILSEYNPNFKNEDLLAFYLVTGGIARYMEELLTNRAFTKKKIFDAILWQGSYFIEEGRTVLIDEFGSDYGNYFSILSLIASGKTSRGEIESVMNISIGGFLDRLENEYNVIKKNRPFLAKEGSKDVKFKMKDNFLSFWFRFIYKYRSAVEIGNFDYVRGIVERDYETYSGLILERYFRQKLIESKQFSDISAYWNRKGENEIDIIAVNEMEKRLVFYEVKRNKKRISIPVLQKKSTEIAKNYPDFNIEYQGLSIEDM
ncbi:MAG: ATP-binding protein [Dysgonamonadaceae bacterium]|jgi:AAA+ ATPase superfamily predicted ATPase|nr:ATP-binding protein [Dysgonamonadaceae bacterium]